MALWTSIADAVFLNGATLHPDGRRCLMGESAIGRIFAIDMQKEGASTWIADDRLKPVGEGVPGANGVKFFDGYVHVSVTGSNLLFRVPVGSDGACGHLEAWAEKLRADDFSFDAGGAAYIAMHPANSVLHLGADGSGRTLAGPDSGVVGSTATAFSRARGDTRALYVTSNGGLWSPHQAAPQPAALLRMEVDVAGELPGAGLRQETAHHSRPDEKREFVGAPHSILMLVTSHGDIHGVPTTGIWFTEFSEPCKIFRLRFGCAARIPAPSGSSANVDSCGLDARRRG